MQQPSRPPPIYTQWIGLRIWERLVSRVSGKAPDPLIGTILDGRFEVIERVGAGGMGAVYRATQLNVERDVAVKLLSTELSHDPTLAARFRREAKTLAKLDHPNILKLHDFGETADGRLYIVTELFQGEPLNEILARGALAPRRAGHILQQIAASLQCVHAEGIVHRDLKPGNIFISRYGSDEHVKALDFGIAHAVEGTLITGSGTLCGTPAYMSPEQARGEKAEAQSDLYSLGVVAFECLSGTLPFKADTAVGLLLKHLNDPPPQLSDVVEPGPISAELESLVMQLLAKLPDQRPPGAATVRALLEMFEDGRTVVAVPGSTVPLPSSPTPTVPPPARVNARASTPSLASATSPSLLRDLGSQTQLPHPDRAERLRLPGFVGILCLLAAVVVAVVAYQRWPRGREDLPVLSVMAQGSTPTGQEHEILAALPVEHRTEPLARSSTPASDRVERDAGLARSQRAPTPSRVELRVTVTIEAGELPATDLYVDGKVSQRVTATKGRSYASAVLRLWPGAHTIFAQPVGGRATSSQTVFIRRTPSPEPMYFDVEIPRSPK